MEILMVRPYQFYFNQQTASNNFFQSNVNIENANELAIAEFDAMVDQLHQHQIKVKVVQDTKDPSTPDSIFPNNWISTHPDGTLCLYPMFAPNRRAERKSTVIDLLQSNFKIENIIDLTDLENEGKFLEGTGSMVLDQQNKIAYGCLSERLNIEAFNYWCVKMDYKPICFKALDDKGQPIYHTNVMMCMGNQFVVICLDSIADASEKQILLESFIQTNKEVIIISQNQLNHFAGNMLQVFDIAQKPHLILSQQAYASLHAEQLNSLEKYNPLLPIAIPTIEALGGGSTRCMMAEILLINK
jgi:hypothetical protein